MCHPHLSTSLNVIFYVSKLPICFFSNYDYDSHFRKLRDKH